MTDRTTVGWVSDPTSAELQPNAGRVGDPTHERTDESPAAGPNGIGVSGGIPTAAGRCSRLGELVASIDGQALSCGCGGPIGLHRCAEFPDELVMPVPVDLARMTARFDRDTIRAEHDAVLAALANLHGAFRRRVCLTCPRRRIESWPAWPPNSDPRDAAVTTHHSPLTPNQHAPAAGGSIVIPLPSVTLATVNCVDPALGAEALSLSTRGLAFGRVLLLSHVRPNPLPDGIDFAQLPNPLDLEGYNLFCLRDLFRYVDQSEHVLTIQTDGFVLHPEQWDPHWLAWDYIGAPWKRRAAHARFTRVGNSGFCLRSRKLLEATAELFGRKAEELARVRWKRILDDIVTCSDLYQELVKRGLRFAPPEVAVRFAFEAKTGLGGRLETAFGFHGTAHPPAVLLRARSSVTAAPQRAVVLVVSYFRPADAWRRTEIDRALRENLDCPAFSRVIAVCDDGVAPPFSDSKLSVTVCQNRPLFSALVRIADENCGPADVRVIANADIGFDATAGLFRELGTNEFWCIARHEESPDGPEIWNVPWAQDVWAWSGNCRAKQLDFQPGTVACDNVIAARAKAAGYKMRNPARSVVCQHYHRDPQRSALSRLPPPYVWIDPHVHGQPGKVRVIRQHNGPSAPAFPKVQQPPFLLVATRPRAGAHYLKSLLESVSGVRLLWEPFHGWAVNRLDSWDRSVDPTVWLRTRPWPDRLFGAVVQDSETRDCPECVPALLRVPTAVVILHRANTLAQYVSMLFAEQYHDWGCDAGLPPRQGTLRVDPAELIAFRRRTAAGIAEDVRRHAAKPHFVLTYERLISDHAGVAAELRRLTGIEFSKATANTSKRENRPLPDVVENWSELLQKGLVDGSESHPHVKTRSAA